MLTHLSIHNYALIQALEFEPSARLNIITGETGAGKSILLGAVGLLLGNRADTKSLWDTSKKCVVEGTFRIEQYDLETFFEENDLDYEPSVIIRREIAVSGKSRAFVNDTPVLLDTLRSLGRVLMDVHSQHDTFMLGTEAFQIQILDQFSESDLFVKAYKKAYLRYQEARNHHQMLLQRESELRKDVDYNAFLLEELESAGLYAGMQEEKESELKELEGAEDIKLQLNAAIESISTSEYAAVAGIQQAMQSLRAVSSYGLKYEEAAKRLESASIELLDLTSELEGLEQQVEHNPERIEQLKDDLSKLYQLQQKHQVVSIEDLLNIQSEISRKVEQSVDIGNELVEAQELLEKAKSAAESAAMNLRERRNDGKDVFATHIIEILQALGIPNASITWNLEPCELYEHGMDRATILFSANKGIDQLPLKQVASGGEFSRLMFAIKYLLAGKTSRPTVIFDEIDTGVSGEVALKLGAYMKFMSGNHQVISISHLPQIAAGADKHFFVYKVHDQEKSTSRIKELDGDEHVQEVAKMISGNEVTSASLDSARELIARSN